MTHALAGANTSEADPVVERLRRDASAPCGFGNSEVIAGPRGLRRRFDGSVGCCRSYHGPADPLSSLNPPPHHCKPSWFVCEQSQCQPRSSASGASKRCKAQRNQGERRFLAGRQISRPRMYRVILADMNSAKVPRISRGRYRQRCASAVESGSCMAKAPALVVSRHLHAAATGLHAAPPPRVILRGVIEVQRTGRVGAPFN